MAAKIDFTVPPWRERFRVLLREAPRLNYANFLDRLVTLYGRRTAFILDEPLDYPGFAGDVMSFDDVGGMVSRIAGSLRTIGVAQGDRVGLITMNRIELAFANFAAARIGAIPVPMNFQLTAHEIAYIADKAGIEVLVCDPAILGTIGGIGNVPNVKTWVMTGTDDAPEGVTTLRSLMADAPAHVEPVEPASQRDTALLFFTSGTTGFPKGAMLSHQAAMVGIHSHVRASGLSPVLKDRISLAVMPVAHAAGYAMMLLNLGMGTPVAFLSTFDPQAIFRAVERLRPTVFSGTPTMFRMLFDAGARDVDWSSIRVFGGGADAFSDELVKKVRALGARTGPLGITRKPWFVRGYGMAEANSYLAQTPPFPAGDNCCGWVLPPVKYRLIDEAGNDVPKGQPGELVIKGPNVTSGYWNDPEATQAAFTPDGWFRTGDVLRKGKLRMLYFVGRTAEIIKSGGYKISASEIDNVLMSHPDVEGAATVGIPHEVKGERPFSAVKLRAGCSTTTDDVLAFARERLARYKCPRGVVALDEIPMTFSMKPKRREVRERLIAELPAE